MQQLELNCKGQKPLRSRHTPASYITPKKIIAALGRIDDTKEVCTRSMTLKVLAEAMEFSPERLRHYFAKHNLSLEVFIETSTTALNQTRRGFQSVKCLLDNLPSPRAPKPVEGLRSDRRALLERASKFIDDLVINNPRLLFTLRPKVCSKYRTASPDAITNLAKLFTNGDETKFRGIEANIGQKILEGYRSVLERFAREGYTTTQMASALGIGPRTVKHYRLGMRILLADAKEKAKSDFEEDQEPPEILQEAVQ